MFPMLKVRLEPTWAMWMKILHHLQIKIERYSIPEPMSGCWLWIGGTKINASGIEYGKVAVNYGATFKTVAAHRASYRAYKGPIPEGLNVCHTCDLGLCVNPDHLFVGTQKENIADAVRKGRMRPGVGGMMSDRYGEDWPTAKLSNADVVKILRSNDTHKSLAKRFGISPGHVGNIKTGRDRKVR